MAIKRFLNIPWQVSVLVTLAIYLAVGWSQARHACQESFYFGFCGLGMIFLVFFGVSLLLLFGIIVFVLWKITPSPSADADAKEVLNRRVLLVGIFFSTFPVIFQLIS
jgi:hypothetical protein